MLTYAELRERALRLARGLRRAARPGARIAVASENRPEYLELMFGAWAAECVIVPINAKLHPLEMLQIVDDADAALVFASPKLAEALAARDPARARAQTVVIGGDAYAACFDADPATPPQSAPESLAWLFYTSGTTGRSKGAMLSHRNLMAMTIAHLADVEALDEP